MKATVSFLVAGSNPHRVFQNLALKERLVRTTTGLADCILTTQQLPDQSNLVLVDRAKFLDLQERQKITRLRPEASPGQAWRREDIKLLLAVKPTNPQMPNNEIEEHEQNVARIQETLRKSQINFNTLSADEVTPERLGSSNLVLVAGGDGTFLRVAKKVDGTTPVFGINSAPLTSFAHYLKLRAETLEETMAQLLAGQFRVINLPRIEASVNGSDGFQHVLPSSLNDIFVKDNAFAKATRNFFTLAGRKEFLYSDGLLVSTSSACGPNSWMINAGGIFLMPGSPLLQIMSFNTNLQDRQGQPNLLTHVVTDTGFEIESANRHQPFCAVDGEKEGNFPAGQRLIIKGTNTPLKFIEFLPETPDEPAETTKVISLPRARMADSVSADLIQQLDQMQVCRSVANGGKKQVLLLRVAEDLSSLRFFAVNKFGGQALSRENIVPVAEIKKPLLLYPTAEIAALPSVSRDIIHNLYRYGSYFTEMAGVLVELDAGQDINVWGPTIDSLFSLWALRRHNFFNSSVHMATEVATGTGMLAKAAVLFCPNLKVIEITDIEANALRSAERNIQPALRPGVYLSSFHGPGIRRIGQTDLMIVNPPYIPKKRPNENNPYEGTGLIREIVAEGLNHLTPGNPQAVVFMNYSSLAEKAFQEYVSGQPGLQVERLETLAVPLKINWMQINPDWLNYLLAECGLEVRDDVVSGYRYWHTLNAVRLTRKTQL